MFALRSVWFYVEFLVAALLILIGLIAWLFIHFLEAWNIFIGSYLISRVIIWYVADVLKVRLRRPIDEEAAKRMVSSPKLDAKEQMAHTEDYAKMNYGRLREIAKDPNRLALMSNDAFRSFASNYAYKVQKRIIHIHHFILGIPLMPLTWVLFFYDIRWAPFYYPPFSLGMIFAGSTFALFMSEFWHLLTQDWGP